MRVIRDHDIPSSLQRVAVIVLGTISSGCAGPALISTAPSPLAPGEARLWFYRTTDFSVSRNVANIELNGTRILSLPPYGPGTYVDVQPGTYQITVENFGVESNQSKTVTVAPAQEIFAKIEVSETYLSGGGGQGVHRDAFAVLLIPPDKARTEVANP